MKIVKLTLKILAYIILFVTVLATIFGSYLFFQINRSDGEIETGEGNHKYILHIPETYDEDEPTLF
jgi:hypothetical protein